MISAAVHEILLPIMKEIKNDLNSVKNDLSSLNKTVSNLSGDLEDYKQQTASELTGLQSNMTSELARLQSNVTSELAGLNSVKNDLNSVKNDMSSLNKTVISLNDSMNRISDNVEAHDNHVTTELMELDQNLQQNFSLQLNNSFGYIYPVYTCGGTGGWRRVVYLNFTDPNIPCPSSWRLTSHSKRTCSKVNTSALSCDSVTFPVSGGDYTRVCGRIIGYQYKSTDGFWAYYLGNATTIDGPYVDGVSLTHGSPRQHIWTFAAGHSEISHPSPVLCPCDTTFNITIPPFVGGDYFCESGHNSEPLMYRFHSDDPIWDGDGCTASSTCCSFNNPPYFTKQLPNPTTDDIEARLCHSGSISDEDTPIEFIELYVQ